MKMKKITLFLDKSFRQNIREWSIAYHAALAFYAELIWYLSDPHANLAADIIQAMRQGEHPVHLKRLESVIWPLKEAHRIEACITLRYKFLSLEVRAYDSGKQTPYVSLDLQFASDGTTAAGGSTLANRERCV